MARATKKSKKSPRRKIKSKKSTYAAYIPSSSTVYKTLLLSGTLGLLGAVALRRRATPIQPKTEAEYVARIKEIDEATKKCYQDLMEMEKIEDEKLGKFIEILKLRAAKRTELSKNLAGVVRGYFSKKKQLRDRQRGGGTRKGGSRQRGGFGPLGAHSGKTFGPLKDLDDDLKYSLSELEKCKQFKETIKERYAKKIDDLTQKIKADERLGAMYKYNIEKYK